MLGELSEFASLGRGRESPPALQSALDGLEHQAIDYVAERNNQNHDRDDCAHVIQVASHHQDLSETETEIQHLGGDERTPCECPALLQAGDNKWQTRRQ